MTKDIIKALFLSVMMLVSATIMMADNRPLEEMQAIAASKLRDLAAERGLRKAPILAHRLQCVANEETYAVFSSEDATGFVIVAKSTLADALIGYSAEPFDANRIPPAMQWYLSEVSRNLQAIEAGEAHSPRRAATYTPVANFVTTVWSQFHPFNVLTPNNYPSGCVATALAQCMNYCQYPSSAEFDAYYYVTTDEQTERKSAHVNSTYTWPYRNRYRLQYNDNIDELLRDCGYAVYMNYASDGSGSTVHYAGQALTQIFGYPEECVKYYDWSYWGDSQEAWNQLIYDELGLRSPILFAATTDDQDGHAFLFSGVDADGLVYVNWGWGGDSDGFYNIQTLETGSLAFSTSHRMVTGIRTTPLITDHVQPRIWSNIGTNYTYRWGTELDEEEGKQHVTLYIDIPGGLGNVCPSTFQGVFGLFAQDLTDGTTWVIAEDLQDRETLPPGYGYYADEGEEFYFYYFVDGLNGLKPGHTYRLSFGTKDDREGTWHSIICHGGEMGYDVTYTGDPATCTVSTEPTSVPVMTGIKEIERKTPSDSPSMGSGWYDLNGRSLLSREGSPQGKGFYIVDGKKMLVR